MPFPVVDDSVPLLVGAGPSPLLLPRTLTSTEKDPCETVRIADGANLCKDLAEFFFEGYNEVQGGALMRPSLRTFLNQPVAQNTAVVNIGAFTVIGTDCVCEASQIGRFVRVDERCIVGAGVRIPDGVWLRSSSWVPSDAILTPFTVYDGCPVRATGRTNPDAHRLMQMEFVRQRLGLL